MIQIAICDDSEVTLQHLNQATFAKVHTLENLFIVFPISWVVTILLVWGGFLFIKPFQKNALFNIGKPIEKKHFL